MGTHLRSVTCHMAGNVHGITRRYEYIASKPIERHTLNFTSMYQASEAYWNGVRAISVVQ